MFLVGFFRSMYIRAVDTEGAMTKEYRAKVFKSGNSVALRLPKGLGIEEGAEMNIREERGRFIVERKGELKRKFDVSKIWGIMPDFPLQTAEDRTFEEREFDWNGKRLREDG
jgi:antitoxin VapB